MEWVIQQWNQDSEEAHIITDEPKFKKVKARLRKACSEAKVMLNGNKNSDKVDLFVDDLFSGTDLEIELSRAQFEEICKK